MTITCNLSSLTKARHMPFFISLDLHVRVRTLYSMVTHFPLNSPTSHSATTNTTFSKDPQNMLHSQFWVPYKHCRCWIPWVSRCWRRVDKNLYHFKLLRSVLWVYYNSALLFHCSSVPLCLCSVICSDPRCWHRNTTDMFPQTHLRTINILYDLGHFQRSSIMLELLNPSWAVIAPLKGLKDEGNPGCSRHILLFSYSTQRILLKMEKPGFSFLAFSGFIFLTKIIKIINKRKWLSGLLSQPMQFFLYTRMLEK